MTFNNKILHSFVPVFNEKSVKLCEVLERKVSEGHESFDISMNIFATTLEMVCGKFFNKEIVVIYVEKHNN